MQSKLLVYIFIVINYQFCLGYAQAMKMLRIELDKLSNAVSRRHDAKIQRHRMEKLYEQQLDFINCWYHAKFRKCLEHVCMLSVISCYRCNYFRSRWRAIQNYSNDEKVHQVWPKFSHVINKLYFIYKGSMIIIKMCSRVRFRVHLSDFLTELKKLLKINFSQLNTYDARFSSVIPRCKLDTLE